MNTLLFFLLFFALLSGLGVILGNRLRGTSSPPSAPSPPNKALRISLLLLGATLVFLLLPLLLRALFGPGAGGFDPTMLTIATLAALEFFATVSMAFAAYCLLFPGLYAYVRDSLEEKLFQTLTTDLVDRLPSQQGATLALLRRAAEQRHIVTLQFTIRCVRFTLSLLPFFVFLRIAERMVSAALTIVPH